MIVCECGMGFQTGCQHAKHKIETGEPDKHRLTCSADGCYTILGKLDENFKGLVIEQNKIPVFIYCENCRDFIAEFCTLWAEEH